MYFADICSLLSQIVFVGFMELGGVHYPLWQNGTGLGIGTQAGYVTQPERI
jgi:hypothetical protein